MTSSVANPSDPLGFDVAFIDGDLDPSGRSASGVEIVDEAILRRLTCKQLYLIDGDADGLVDFGINVREWAQEAVTAETLASKPPIVEDAVRRDPRIAHVTASLSVASGETFADGERVSFTIAIHYTTITGITLDRIVGVSSVTADFLAQGR
jgi:hypothetical protein